MTTYWHGGAPNLERGAVLLPPSRTGRTFTRASQAALQRLDRISQRGDRVHITPDRGLARVYAGGWSDDGVHFGYGWLYEVAVDHESLEPDADLVSLPGVSFQVPTASVVRVAERAVRPHQRRFTEKLTEMLGQLEQAKRG